MFTSIAPWYHNPSLYYSNVFIHTIITILVHLGAASLSAGGISSFILRRLGIRLFVAVGWCGWGFAGGAGSGCCFLRFILRMYSRDFGFIATACLIASAILLVGSLPISFYSLVLLDSLIFLLSFVFSLLFSSLNVKYVALAHDSIWYF